MKPLSIFSFQVKNARNALASCNEPLQHARRFFFKKLKKPFELIIWDKISILALKLLYNCRKHDEKEIKMSKIIFKRLTVKEEARITAGGDPSNTNDPVNASDRQQCGRYTVGDPCIVTEVVNCEQAISDNQCILNINDKYSG